MRRRALSGSFRRAAADLEAFGFPVDDLWRCVRAQAEIEARLDAEPGAREPGSMTPHQVFGNRLAATIMRTLYGVAVTDLGPFRAIRRADLLALQMREMTYESIQERGFSEFFDWVKLQSHQFRGVTFGMVQLDP